MQLIKNYIINHQNAILFLFIVLVGGIVCGTLLINYFTYDEIITFNSALISYPKETENLRNYFTQQVFLNSIMLTFLLICGYSLFAIPLISFIIFTKGLQIGFSSSVFMLYYKAKGMIAIAGVLFPQVVFELLAYLIVSVCACEVSYALLHVVNTTARLVLNNFVKDNLNTLLCSFILIIISFFIKCNYFIIIEFIQKLL